MRCPECFKFYGDAYTKEMLEEDLAELEMIRHALRQALLGKLIDGIELNRQLDAADRKERKLHGKKWFSGQRFSEMCDHMRREHGMTASQVEASLNAQRERSDAR